MIRSLIYIRQPEHSIDERGFAVAKAVRDAQTGWPSAQPAGAEADVPRPIPAADDGSGSGGAGATRAIADRPGTSGRRLWRISFAC